MNKVIITILILFNILLFLLLTYNYKNTSTTTVEEKIVVDTVYIDKIIIDTVPQLVYEEKVKLIYDTLFIKDTQEPVEVEIPITQKVYKNEVDSVNYTAYVSGYHQTLDSINFSLKYPQVTIYKEAIIKTRPKFTHGIQFGVGYGIINKQPDLYIGYGIQYNF